MLSRLNAVMGFSIDFIGRYYYNNYGRFMLSRLDSLGSDLKEWLEQAYKTGS